MTALPPESGAPATVAPRPRLSTHGVTALICAALLALLAATVGASAWLLREHEITDWRADLGNLSQLLAENVAQSLGSGHLMLDSLAGLAHGHVDAIGSMEVYLSMRDQAAMLPQIAVALIADAQGTVRASSNGYPAANASVAARDYFQYHRAHPVGQPFLSAPERSPRDGRHLFYLSQRLDDAHGKFAGVAVVGISIDHFNEWFRSASLNGHVAIALYRQDGTPLARWPEAAASGAPPHLASGKQHDTVYHPGSDAAVGSLVDVRAVRDYPLLLVAGISDDTLLADWQTNMRLIGAVGGSSAVVMLAAFWLVARLLVRRESDARAALALKARADQASAAKSRFLAMVSHEVRMPISDALAISEQLRATELDVTQRQYADNVHHSVAHLQRILSDVLDYSRMETGQIALTPQPYDPEQLLQDLLAMHRADAESKGLQLRYRCAAPPGQVEGDPAAMRQVLGNLIDNAIKFTHSGEVEVTFNARPEGERWLLRYAVRDSGVGIAADAQSQLFEPFSQPQRDAQAGGTGLGLAICRRLVGLMGGVITCASTPGAGATFSVEVPSRYVNAPVPVAAPQPEPASAPAPAPASGKRVLLVEDSEMNRQLARILLKKLDWEVDEAHDGAQALVALESKRYDVVLMDCMMPVMDGYEATRRFRDWEQDQRRPRTPVVALTASVIDGDRERCLAAGADDYLSKPFTTAAFADMLARWRDPTDAPQQHS